MNSNGVIARTLFVATLFGPNFCRVSLGQEHRAIPVHHIQGAAHAFLTLRAESGAVLGYGEFFQMLHSGRVTTRLTYHFRDGSLDEETAVYSQGATFHLINDHHIQRGPFFSKDTDFLVDEDGNVTVRSSDKSGKQKIEKNRLDLPPDVSNGLIGIMLLSVPPSTPTFKLSWVAPVGKGRLIDLSVDVEGRQPFSPVVGVRRKATVFRIHPELGGITGIVAPLIGKQPKDAFVWIMEGDVPSLVREIGPLEEGGPIVSVEPAGTSYPPAVVTVE